MTRRPALIFDFGNVLAHFDYRKAADRFAAHLGVSGADLLARIGPLGFAPLLQDYESGKLTTEEFSRRLCQMIDLELTPDDFAAAWSNIFWRNEPIARLVAALKARGYTLVLGSNTNDLHARQFRRQFAADLAHFDRLVLSFEIGHIKPSAAFYHECVHAAARVPEQCVFIDDLAENVEGARAAGLVGVQFRDVASLLPELEALGIDVA